MAVGETLLALKRKSLMMGILYDQMKAWSAPNIQHQMSPGLHTAPKRLQIVQHPCQSQSIQSYIPAPH